MSQNKGKRLLLISHHNSYRIAPYIKAANNLGLHVTIASQGKHSLVSEIANGLHIDFTDTEQALADIIKENANQSFAGILGSDDQTVELAAHAAHALKLPHNPPDAARYSHRKDLARAQLNLTGCSVPLHRLLDLSTPLEEQLDNLPWPCVLKPLNMSASRGVIRVENKVEFISASKKIKSIISESTDKFERNHLLIEEYIDGYEIAFEGFLQNGELKQITIFDKPDPLTGPYFAETIYVSPSSLSNKQQNNIKDTIQQACTAYDLNTGAIHAECRIDSNNKVWILEIASRTIGGDCARILDNKDFNIEELAIKLAIGESVSVNKPEQVRAVMMIPVTKKGLLRRIEGLLDARKVRHINKVDIIINEGHELVPLPEGNQYLGYIFASAETREDVINAIRSAYSLLKFVTAPVFKIKAL